MNALQLLRNMHADTRVRFKVLLATDDWSAASKQWAALKPLLDLHETLEDRFVYTPVAQECGAATPLGDWEVQHEADVALVKDLIEAVDEIDPKTPEWRMGVARVMDALSRHVMDEEGQIFGRIEQVWGPDKLASVGAQMQKAMPGTSPTGSARRTPKQAVSASARRGR